MIKRTSKFILTTKYYKKKTQ